MRPTTATPGIPFPSSTTPRTTLPWPDTAIAEFDHRAATHGADQRQATTVLLTLAALGIRDLDRYTRKWSPDDFAAWIAHAASEYVDPTRYPRRDLINATTH